jgi:hypothetical protein
VSAVTTPVQGHDYFVRSTAGPGHRFQNRKPSVVGVDGVASAEPELPASNHV